MAPPARRQEPPRGLTGNAASREAAILPPPTAPRHSKTSLIRKDCRAFPQPCSSLTNSSTLYGAEFRLRACCHSGNLNLQYLNLQYSKFMRQAWPHTSPETSPVATNAFSLRAQITACSLPSSWPGTGEYSGTLLARVSRLGSGRGGWHAIGSLEMPSAGGAEPPRP